ncbi:MAG: NAD(P)H-dependent oxidoreductase [Acidobacteria bacterium]|nr:NAD(P)H-dependent oxidoreductase [Acidobacteriota bacterium]
MFEGLGELPHFNPDLDVEPFPQAVLRWREALTAADGVVISSPEYAHGVPGVLKNALDWVVGSGEFMYKPVVLVDLGGRSEFVYVQLAEILRTMMAQVVLVRSVEEAVLSLKGEALPDR